jgi:hypothetical protein
MQCTYEWDEELILEELDAFLGIWRSATPNLQVLEVWLGRTYDRWKDAEVAQLRTMCEEAGLLCIVHWQGGYMQTCCSVINFQWVRQGPHPSSQPPLVLDSDEELLPDE